MNIWIVVSSLSILAAIVLFTQYALLRKKIKEVHAKVVFALEGPRNMLITYSGGGYLGKLVDNFNILSKKCLALLDQNATLDDHKKETEKLSVKVVEFEKSMNQTTMFTEIGKKITANLNIKEIVKNVFNYIKSSMNVDEMQVMFIKAGKPILVHVDHNDLVNEVLTEDGKKANHLMNWVMENMKEVMLNDAPEDYAQYVYDPIVSKSGNKIGAVLCVPMSMHNANVGVIAVSSHQSNVYNKYHLEFIRTLGSYLTVALDNASIHDQLNKTKLIIEEEKGKSEKLLLNILPEEIAEELKLTGEAEARSFDNATILFSDFMDFTEASEKLTPKELIAELNFCFMAFDELCDKYNVEKIKTIGDSFMAAGGIPVASVESTKNTVLFGIEMSEYILKRIVEREAEGKIPFHMRVGINTGPVVAGIVGKKKFQYDIWGDAVNIASRMESQGAIGKVNISQKTYDIIKNDTAFRFDHRGKIEAKGKGEIDMYYVSRA
ncbi:MAG: class 3 adenylate cyclase [Bacteroidia bacterium]|jgi:class 3 adenylate cyclase